MLNGVWSNRAAILASFLTLLGASTQTFAADPTTDSDVAAQLQGLRSRVVELEAKQCENWLTAERTNQIKAIVHDVLEDAKSRGQFADGPDMGYNGGFYIQTADKNYKLVLNGYAQIRYEFAQSHINNGRTISSGGPTGVGNRPGVPRQFQRI